MMGETQQSGYEEPTSMNAPGEALVASLLQQMIAALRGQEYQQAQQMLARLARLVRYGERAYAPSLSPPPRRGLRAWIRRRLQPHSSDAAVLARALAREDEAFYRQEEYERISARALCILLRWHHAIIAETLPAADSAERLADLQHYLSALRQAQDTLATYYGLPAAEAAEVVYYPMTPLLYLGARGRGAI